jgi:hypothetical protein
MREMGKKKEVDLKELEKVLGERIFPDLERGRPDFDGPHTRAVVRKLKEIWENVPGLEADRVGLLIAAYAHDWGYADLFKKGEEVQFGQVVDAKSEHMRLGAEKLRKLLREKFFDGLTKVQKERAAHLVKVHDDWRTLKDEDELTLMEADVLGATDTDLVTPGFDYESNKDWMRAVREKKLPRFIHPWAVKEAKRLLKGREKYYERKYKGG